MSGLPDSPGGDSEGPRVYGRPRLAAADLDREAGSRVRVRVALERGGVRFQAEREGVGEEIIVLRLAAEATLEALEGAVSGATRFELVGIKRMHAFDTRVVLVCVRPAEQPGRRLIGCVPTFDDLVRGAATAVLHATNRLVEILPPPDREPRGRPPDRKAEGRPPDRRAEPPAEGSEGAS